MTSSFNIIGVMSGTSVDGLDLCYVSFTKDFLIIGSAHNNKEIIIKNKQRVRILFLSSIFKKNKNYLGINKFKLLSIGIELQEIIKKSIRRYLIKLNLIILNPFSN